MEDGHLHFDDCHTPLPKTFFPLVKTVNFHSFYSSMTQFMYSNTINGDLVGDFFLYRKKIIHVNRLQYYVDALN